MTFEEIFDGAEETTFFQEVAESIRTDNAEALEEAMAQRDQEWSLLASQVVGQEQFS